MDPEFWLPMGAIGPQEVADRARQLQADGWDGMTIYDTQCLSPETIVMMTAAALATETLKLSISISNPVTRHPSVAAAAMLTLASLVGDRIYYGIGRGDSSQAHIGGAPASFELFERYISAVRRYLDGQAVPFEDIDDWRLTRPVAAMQFGHAPEASRIAWKDPSVTPPPIEIAATGPRALALAGKWADRALLGVGADVKRVTWAIEQVRAARSDARRDRTPLSVSIPISVGVADDMDEARGLVSNIVAAAARFAVISGSVVGPVSDEELRVYEALGRSYDMEQHGRHGNQLAVLTDAFIDTYAIVGPPARCIERLLELNELGVDAFAIAPPMHGSASESRMREGYRRIVEEVLPKVRKHARAV